MNMWLLLENLSPVLKLCKLGFLMCWFQIPTIHGPVPKLEIELYDLEFEMINRVSAKESNSEILNVFAKAGFWDELHIFDR